MLFFHGLMIVLYIVMMGAFGLAGALGKIHPLVAALLVIWCIGVGFYHAVRMEQWENRTWTS